MAAIRNSTYFLRIKSKKDEKSTHHLEIIDRELTRSDEVIQRLLQLTKGGSLKRKMTDLRDLAREAMTYASRETQLFPSSSIPNTSLSISTVFCSGKFCTIFSSTPSKPCPMVEKYSWTLANWTTEKPCLCFRSRGGNRRDDDEKDIRTSFYQQERRRRLRLVSLP